jgi:hypothetical protein
MASLASTAAFADDPKPTARNPPRKDAPKGDSKEDDAKSGDGKAADPNAKPADKPPEKKDDKPKVDVESKAFQDATFNQINGSAAQIDACTARYIEEFPDRKGVATVSFAIQPDGKVGAADVKCDLQASQNLVTCLRDIPRHWNFPPIGDQKLNSSLPIHVGKGQKFRLKKPGEKDEKPASPAEEEDTAVTWTPSFTPGWNQ